MQHLKSSLADAVWSPSLVMCGLAAPVKALEAKSLKLEADKSAAGFFDIFLSPSSAGVSSIAGKRTALVSYVFNRVVPKRRLFKS